MNQRYSERQPPIARNIPRLGSGEVRASNRWDGDAWRELPVPGESMPYALAVVAGGLVCGMADGRLLHSPDRGESWRELAVTAAIVAMAIAA